MQYRYDVFGGNPRLSTAVGISRGMNSPFVVAMKQCIDCFFNDPSKPTQRVTEDNVDWTVGVICGYTCGFILELEAIMSTLFLKHVKLDDGTIEEVPSSSFMGMLAGYLIETNEPTFMPSLEERIVGQHNSSGMGYFVEYLTLKVPCKSILYC